jgi:hypothetical protein
MRHNKDSPAISIYCRATIKVLELSRSDQGYWLLAIVRVVKIAKEKPFPNILSLLTLVLLVLVLLVLVLLVLVL